MYKVTKYGKEIGTGTLTECIEHIATTMSQFHPEQVTQEQAVEAGYSISRA
jgi:hypothetical protein